jgi:hypothetical protein
MAFNPAPSGYFSNINVGQVVSGTTGVFIPWSNLENFNSSTSGDIRQLVYAFNQAVATEYNSLPNSGLSTQFSIRVSQVFPDVNTIKKTYTTSVNLAFSGDLGVVYESGV